MLKFALASLVLPLALTAKAESPIDMSKVTSDQWAAVAQSQLTNHGSITVGIPGAVRHSIPQNQKGGQDCWSFSLNGMIEALVNSTRARGDVISVKLSPEYLEFWHIYSQIEADMPAFNAVVQQMLQDPSSTTTQNRVQAIANTYQANVRQERGASTAAPASSANVDPDFTIPDEGSNAGIAMNEIEEFGTVTYEQFPVSIRDVQTEAAFEANVSTVIYNLLTDALNGKINLTDYIQANTSLNQPLILRLRAGLEPVYKHQVPMPTDTWVDITTEKSYTALSYMQMVHGLGLNFTTGYADSSSGYSSHRTNMQAIAVGMITTNLPALLGFAIFQDNLPNDQATAWDFANTTGVFTSMVCPNGLCVNVAGGHEVEVVNFMGKMADGSAVPAGFTQAQMLNWVETNQFQVTALIIKNSWGSLNSGGTVGRDANGQVVTEFLEGGYFIVSDEYISNDFIAPNNIPYDFTVPTSIHSLYPDLPYFAQ